MNLDHVKIEPGYSARAGGQQVSVCRTDVRVTHVPTGISVVVAHMRSQSKNKDAALDILAYAVNKLAPEYNGTSDNG